MSGTVGMYTATYSKGLAYDTEKNVAVYESVSGLPIAGSDETVLAFDVGVASSLSVFYQVIPGKTVNEIEHAGSFIGASAGPIRLMLLCFVGWLIKIQRLAKQFRPKKSMDSR